MPCLTAPVHATAAVALCDAAAVRALARCCVNGGNLDNRNNNARLPQAGD